MNDGVNAGYIDFPRAGPLFNFNQLGPPVGVHAETHMDGFTRWGVTNSAGGSAPTPAQARADLPPIDLTPFRIRQGQEIFFVQRLDGNRNAVRWNIVLAHVFIW